MYKFHIGCGTVYLLGWVNVDLPSNNTFLRSEKPDLVDLYATTEDNYYGKHKAETLARFTAGPKTVETVCDRFGSFQHIPARDCTVNKILSRQVFEHFDIDRAKEALKECYRVLLPGGELTIDVPDMVQSIMQYGDTKDNFYIRHIVGPKKKGAWGFHCMSYDRQELIQLLGSQGFIYLQEEENIHPYPAICLTFLKK